ncbi:hypothetical protein C8R44DRAFT_861557 [Mycena epipterygia]|nr:hypothetical protein C8R44DRAFT_861557 [Mycena epipterygia]
MGGLANLKTVLIRANLKAGSSTASSDFPGGRCNTNIGAARRRPYTSQWMQFQVQCREIEDKVRREIRVLVTTGAAIEQAAIGQTAASAAERQTGWLIINVGLDIEEVRQELGSKTQRVRGRKGRLFQGDESHVGFVLSLDWFRGGQWAQEKGLGPKEPEINGAAKHGHTPHSPNPLPPCLALTLPSTVPRSARSSRSTAPREPQPPPPPRPRRIRLPEFRKRQRPLHRRFPLPLRRNCHAFCKPPPSETARNPYPSTVRRPPHLHFPRRAAGALLSIGKDTRERERQRIRDAERTAPSAAELLTLHESGYTPTTLNTRCTAAW